jgi:catechol 2,3-dioxygenase-like lactoylglutathione lyase family enzyme
MSARLEHANLLVRDIAASMRFLQTAFPEFRLRFDGREPGKRLQGTIQWVHFGTDETYIALTQATREPQERWQPYAGIPGCNHLAFVVDDVAALQARMTAAGYRNSTPPNHHPYRTRVYFLDPDGNDWEFVQYHSDDPGKRNDYALPEN